MAGYRRSRAAGAALPATAAEARRIRIESRMRARYAEAQTEVERLAVVTDYVRAAASSAARSDPIRTSHTLTDLVNRLKRAGDELLRITGGTR